MISPTVLGVIKDGSFIADDIELHNKARFCHEGRRVELIYKRFYKRRSLPQDKYYFGVVVTMIANSIGEDDIEAVHEILKAQCNYYLAGEQGIRVPLSTKNLTTVEFEEYLDRVRRWAAQYLSLYIPLPNEVTTE